MKTKKFIKKFKKCYDGLGFVDTKHNGRIYYHQLGWDDDRFHLRNYDTYEEYYICFNEVILKKPIGTMKGFIGGIPVNGISYFFVSGTEVLEGCLNISSYDNKQDVLEKLYGEPSVRMPLSPEFREDADRFIHEFCGEPDSHNYVYAKGVFGKFNNNIDRNPELIFKDKIVYYREVDSYGAKPYECTLTKKWYYENELLQIIGKEGVHNIKIRSARKAEKCTCGDKHRLCTYDTSRDISICHDCYGVSN